MKIKYSALVSDMSGKLNGSVATKNRYGSYLRNKVTPVNRKTTYQLAVRAIFTLATQAWRSLTASERSQWNAGATNFSRTNIFGDIRNLSGFNLFVKLNSNLQNVGEAQITVCPLPVSVDSVVLDSVTIDNSSQSVTIASATPIGTNSAVELYATAGLSAGKNFVASEFRKIATLTSSDTFPYVASADYLAKFGVVPAAGTKVFIKAKSIDKTNGIPGAESQVETIVVS